MYIFFYLLSKVSDALRDKGEVELTVAVRISVMMNCGWDLSGPRMNSMYRSFLLENLPGNNRRPVLRDEQMSLLNVLRS